MKSNISKHFEAKSKRGLRFADGMVEGVPDSRPFVPYAIEQILLASYELLVAPVQAAPVQAAPVQAAPVQAAPVQAAPVQAALSQGEQASLSLQSNLNDLGKVNATPGLGEGAQRNFFNKSLSDLQGGNNAYMPGGAGDPHASGPQGLRQATPSQNIVAPQARRPLPQMQPLSFKDGMVHEGPGIVHGPGGPREDKVDAKLSNGEAVLPAATVAALGGAEAVAGIIEATNGKAPARGLREGQEVHAAWGWVDKAKQMAGDVATAVKEKLNGTPPATQDFAPKMPTGDIPEPTYKPSGAPPTSPSNINYDIPPADRNPLKVPKEYDLSADKGFPKSNPAATGAGPAAPVEPGVPGVRSTAVAPKPVVSPGVPGAIRTAGGTVLGMAVGAANKYTDMPIIGGDTDEVNNRKAFYKDPNVSTGDKLINGARDAIDIGLPTIGGGAGLLAGSGLMSIPLSAGGAAAGTVTASGIQSALGDSPLDRYNRKNAFAASEAMRAELTPQHEASVNQGHLPNGQTAGVLDGAPNIVPDIRPKIDKAAAKKATEAAYAEGDVNSLTATRMGDEGVTRLGLRQLTSDTMGKNAVVPEGAQFAFNQDGTPQMRWSSGSDEAAKTLTRGNVKAGTVKDGGGIVSINRGNGKFDNVSLGETKYKGKDGTMGAWDKTQQFEDGTKQAAKDKARLAELQYENAKFNATSDEVKDPRAQAAGLRGLIQHNTEATNQAAMLKAMREANTAAETARHNRAMEAQGAETGKRAQQSIEQMQSNNRSDAFNKRFDELIKGATTKVVDGKEVHDSQAATRMRNIMSKRVDLSKLSVDDLNKAFPEMQAENDFAEQMTDSAKNRPTLARARDWVNGIKPEINGNTPIKVRKAKGEDMWDVGMWDAGVGRKVIEMGGHVRELDEILGEGTTLNREQYDVVRRHLEAQKDYKSLKALDKKYKAPGEK